jgi:hypothetical protein
LMTAHTTTRGPTYRCRERKFSLSAVNEISAQVGRADCRGATSRVAELTVSRLYRVVTILRTLAVFYLDAICIDGLSNHGVEPNRDPAYPPDKEKFTVTCVSTSTGSPFKM